VNQITGLNVQKKKNCLFLIIHPNSENTLGISRLFGEGVGTSEENVMRETEFWYQRTYKQAKSFLTSLKEDFFLIHGIYLFEK